jgi:acetyl esterase/lipase
MNEIPSWPEGAPGSEGWTQLEKESWTPPASPVRFRFIRNVTQPTLTVFLPDPQINTGTAVIVCPGGALHVLDIEHEGFDVARWLNTKGIAAFVLKYRLLETPADDVESEAYFQKMTSDDEAMRGFSHQHQPFVLADGQRAVRLVRERALEWNLEPERIGILGFSAGGFVAASVALYHDASSRPDFAAPIYGAIWEDVRVPENAPPLFLALASDDEFGEIMIQSSLRLYSVWQAAGRSVELHAYANGSHGFGMRVQGLPSDHWIERFHDWLEAQGLVTGLRSSTARADGVRS